MKIPKQWKEWQLWFHYVLLEIIIVTYLHLNNQHWIHESIFNLIILYIIIAFGDQLIHYILNQLTGWKD